MVPARSNVGTYRNVDLGMRTLIVIAALLPLLVGCSNSTGTTLTASRSSPTSPSRSPPPLWPSCAPPTPAPTTCWAGLVECISKPTSPTPGSPRGGGIRGANHLSWGGSVEVFTDDAAPRVARTTSRVLAEGNGMFTEYIYLQGPVVLRFSGELAPAQAAEYETALTTA